MPSYPTDNPDPAIYDVPTPEEVNKALAEQRPTMARCMGCDGEGVIADYEGLEMKCVAIECSCCKGSGKVAVGVFDPICAIHCSECDGQDHHWGYYGEMDDMGEPIHNCKHCSACRLIPDDDED